MFDVWNGSRAGRQAEDECPSLLSAHTAHSTAKCLSNHFSLSQRPETGNNFLFFHSNILFTELCVCSECTFGPGRTAAAAAACM